MYAPFYYWGLWLVAIFSFFLAILVYLKAYRQPKTETFILINAALGFWALALFIFHCCFDQSLIFWLRLSQLIAIFIPVTFIHFVFALLESVEKHKTRLLFFYAIAIILGSFNFTKFFISSIKYSPALGYYHLVPGPVYRIFTLVFVSLVIYGYFLMIKALRQSSGFRRNEIRYYLIGFILGFAGGGTTFLPIYNVRVLPLGIFLLLTGQFILAYAILKRRLMDIRTIVSKGLIYSTITALVFSLVLFTGFAIITYYRMTAPNLKIFLYILGFCFFLVLISLRLRGGLEQLIENLIFKRARASYDELIKGSQKLLTILDKKSLSEFFLQTVIQATDANWGVLWQLDEKNGNYYLAGKAGNRREELWLNEDLFLNQNLAFVDLIKNERRLLLREEILPFFKNIKNENNIEDRLRRSDFSLVIPLFFEGLLKRCLFLGEKRSGDLFSSYELQALTLFSDQAAIALANAQLFQRIQRMKEYNERIVNNVDSGLMVVNGEGRITTFNRKIEQMIALSTNEVLGKTLEVLPSPLDKIILRCWQTKKPISISQLTLNIGQNNTLVVSLSTSLIDEKEGRSGIVIVLADLTEVRRLEEKIRQADKMASIGSMVTQLAHEIKNPLSSIRTFTELLPEKFQDEEFRKRFFSLVSEEIERIDSLITRMLNLGRVDVAQYKMVSIQKVIEDMLSSFDLQLRERNTKIKLTHHGVPSLIWADPRSLKEAFANILINSIQAMPQGGNIDISTRRKKDRSTGKPLLEVSITDEGGGIPKKYLHRIFDPFFTTKQQGSGLGLYICYQIIETHQGEIRVRNTDSGANFTILLPVPENKTSVADEKKGIHGQHTSYNP
jgi:PAS domain S-box-containing protein